MVAHNQAPVEAEMEAFKSSLNRWVRGFALLLIVVQTLIARWTLSPLRRLARDLERVEKGQSHELSGSYPADIQPVTANLNKVLRNELAQKERYRNSMADLAHSLKTPLSVLRGHLQSRHAERLETLTLVVDEQVTRMSAIVDHQLRRASAQVTHTHSHSLIDLTPLIKRLLGALLKVYQSKGMCCDVQLPESLMFPADEADMMELIGNLVENAFKYGRSNIAVRARVESHLLSILIEDDGPGIPQAIHQTILTRGARADTATSGQGIGLAVAVDILSSYGGSLDIFSSDLGGAGFSLRLPITT